MTRNALCTRGLATGATRVSDLQYALESFGCEHVALDAAVTPRLSAAWMPYLTDRRPHAFSAIAPYPAPQPVRQAARFSQRDVRLAAPDRSERAEAIAIVRPTLEAAEQAGATQIILCGGPIPFAGMARAVHALMDQGEVHSTKGRETCTRARQERKTLSAPVADGWSFALETLLPEAEDRGLHLALMEAPGLAWAGARCELAEVIDRFSGANVEWIARPLDRESYTAIGMQATEAERLPSPSATIISAPGGAVSSEQQDAYESSLMDVFTDTDTVTAPVILGTSDGSVFGEWHRRLWQRIADVGVPAS